MTQDAILLTNSKTTLGVNIGIKVQLVTTSLIQPLTVLFTHPSRNSGSLHKHTIQVSNAHILSINISFVFLTYKVWVTVATLHACEHLETVSAQVYSSLFQLFVLLMNAVCVTCTAACAARILNTEVVLTELVG